MNFGEKWYVRNTAGKVFGPIDFATLQNWVRDGRVEPLAGISENLQDWMLAPLKPELEMDWIVENNPGQFYGPTHRAVVDDFVKSGTLSPGARFYCDDRGKADKALKALEAEKAAEADRADKALNGLKSELTTTKAELEALEAEKVAEADRADKALNGLKSELAATKAELDATKTELDATKAELDALKAEKAAVHAREWKTEVLVPEVVVANEPPPPVARTAFTGTIAPHAGVGSPFAGADASSLAALERQAQEELARMRASGSKKFFAFGKKKS